MEEVWAGAVNMTGMGVVAAAQAMSDEEVVARVLAGETALFEVLMRRYNQRLFRVTRSILADEGEAEDVIQDAYVRCYLHLDQFEGRARFSTWLTRIAVHEAIARSRKRQRFVSLEESTGVTEARMSLESRTPSPEQEVLNETVRTVIEAAVDDLPETYRSVFMMREVEGLTTAETAESLDISEEVVKVRLHRARAMMRKHIQKRTGAVTSTAFQFQDARCDQMVASVLERLRSFESQPLEVKP
jgi:RNA polymerase sigma-70 factor (ECF subfamily)